MLVVAAVIVIQLQPQRPNAAAPTSAAYMIGNVQNCAAFSPFMKALGFGQNSALDTRSKYVKGIALRQFDQNGNITRTFQDTSWTQAGYLGAFQSDMQGNIYVIPVPAISILDNPPQKANIIYRIHAGTGLMTPLVDLPALAPPNSQNAYGLLSLTYDCETHSLYASSVAGSTYSQIAGRIFQVDPDTGAVRSTVDYVDAFGLGVFNTVNGKRLYFGMARTPEIYSVALDKNGILSTDIRPETAFTVAGITSDERVQAISFQEPNEMIITTMPFDFNLTAPTEIQHTQLIYSYDYQQDTWHYVSSQVVSS